MRKMLILGMLAGLIICSAGNLFSNEAKGGEEKMLFVAKPLEEIYILGEKMPVEISFKNNTKYPIRLCKPFPIEEKSLFRLRLNKEHLADITDEKIKRKHSHPRLPKIDPQGKSVLILNPGEEHKTEINIAEIVKELELKPGVYNVRLIYTMWIAILKEKVEHLKNKEGKTREWESNEIQITIGR